MTITYHKDSNDILNEDGFDMQTISDSEDEETIICAVTTNNVNHVLSVRTSCYTSLTWSLLLNVPTTSQGLKVPSKNTINSS